MDAAAPPRVAREARLPGGSCGIGAIATALEPALEAAAGHGASCVSVSLELAASPAVDSPATVEAWVERATRTLAFVAAEVTTHDGVRVASASAVFSRPGA